MLFLDRHPQDGGSMLFQTVNNYLPVNKM